MVQKYITVRCNPHRMCTDSAQWIPDCLTFRLTTNFTHYRMLHVLDDIITGIAGK